MAHCSTVYFHCLSGPYPLTSCRHVGHQKTGMNINIVYDVLSILLSSMVTPVLGFFILVTLCFSDVMAWVRTTPTILSMQTSSWCLSSSSSSCNSAIICVNRLSNVGTSHMERSILALMALVWGRRVLLSSPSGRLLGFYSPPGDGNDFHQQHKTTAVHLRGECEPAAHAAPPRGD